MGRVSAADRSQQFVEAAARVIAQEGVTAATTRRIAQEADAPLAALHYCFRSKEDLLLEVYHHLSRDYARQLDPLPEHAGLAEVVDLHMRRIWRRMAASPYEQITTFELLLRGQRLTNPRERDQAQQVNRQMYDAWIRSTASIFDAGAEASGVEPATDTMVAARFAVAGIDGISIQHFSDPDEDRSWLMIDKLVEALQALLLPR
ncbi:TetR/AcrR family transcriptional regulator [Zhihengliuella halotolerans]|uniref:TetR/AcrR family transcriptional regulator n=1 Tax=Zhihengliuella halotolerans TaxID=370736 RepID=UPI000C80FB8E|nr:TetR/AcrR family transcriptional regulator [Zhihengliuella halotolerans]